MRMEELDESLTPVPLAAAGRCLGAETDRAVLPANDVERGTACLLVATELRLWVIARTGSPDPTEPADAAATDVPWEHVGVGPIGTVGRVPGGFLGGVESSEHVLLIALTDGLFEARVPGQRGLESVQAFAREARAFGAREWEP